MTEVASERIMPLRLWATEYMGWKSAGQAYKALKDGRLVLPEGGDGSSVLAEASRRRYEQTSHPSYQWKRRAAPAAPAPALPAQADAAGAAAQQPEQGALDFGTSYDYHGAKAKREHYAAERERLQYMREAGELVPVAAVRAAFAASAAILRARLESLGALLAPQIVHLEEAQARAAINEHVEAAQRAAAQAVEKLGAEYDGAA